VKFFSLLLGFALLAGISGCNNSTSPSSNISLLGTWRNMDTGTTSVLDDSGTLLGTTFVTTTTTLIFQEDETLHTIRDFVFNPKVASFPDTQVTYIGTWNTHGDTLIRDTWPGSLGSIDSAKFTLAASTLKLFSLVQGSSYVQTFSRVK